MVWTGDVDRCDGDAARPGGVCANAIWQRLKRIKRGHRTPSRSTFQPLPNGSRVVPCCNTVTRTLSVAANDRSNTQCFECNAPDVVFENFGDEMILLNLQSGRYFSLSPTGTYYWECISQGVPDAEAVARMSTAYPDASVALDLE